MAHVSLANCNRYKQEMSDVGKIPFNFRADCEDQTDQQFLVSQGCSV